MINTSRPSALKPGIVYFADAGSAICIKCAGATAFATGRDLSGHPVTPAGPLEIKEWESFGEGPLVCDGGCTTAFIPEKATS